MLFSFNFFENMLNVISRLVNFFSSDTTLQHTINIIFTLSRMHSTRTINQINSFSQSDILPNFSFSWNWSSSTNFPLFKWVDNTWLTNVWISYKTYTYVFFISVENVELSEQVDQWTLTEWVGNWCLVCNCWVLFWQMLNPFFQDPNWNQICLVDQQHQMFMWTVLFHMFLKSQRSCTLWISGI